MFESLKKKLANWLGKEEPKEKSPKKPKPKIEKKVAKAKPQRIERKKRSEQELAEERKISSELIEDIKKERGEDVRPIPRQEEIIEALKEQESQEKKQTEEQKQEEKKPGFFSRIFQKATSAKITQEQFNEIFQELEITLLENNVALEVVDKIRETLSSKLIGKEIKRDTLQNTIIEALKQSIEQVLIDPPDLIKQINEKKGVYTIIFFGINGSGKTTTIAKIAHKLKKDGISCVLAAGDTFRAASIEQLEIHANKLGVPIIKHFYGTDPAAVAFDAKKYAEKNNIKVVLIDTAGRMYTKANLLKEMEKIVRISKPDLKIFVGESFTGNDAISQCQTFNETIGIDGIILSKADVDEKAGTILSVSYITNKPIYFLGVGQKLDDLKIFSKKEVIKNLGLES